MRPTLFALAGVLLSCQFAVAASKAEQAGFTKTPLPEGHVMIGTWKIDVPGTDCFEMYDIRADGTMQVTSAGQVVRTEYALAETRTAEGFYRWTDFIVEENGMPDCLGNMVSKGGSATHFITVHHSSDQFLMCQQANLQTCIGPFVREKGI